MLRQLRAEISKIEDANALELATYYHDAIYDPLLTHNEAHSANC